MSTEDTDRSPLDQVKQDAMQGPDSWKYDIDRLEECIRYREDGKRCFSGPKEWDRDYDQYKGIDPLEPNSDLIVVNETGSAVDTYLAFLLYNIGKFNLEPTQPDYYISSLIKEELINYRWRELKVHRTIRQSGYDSGIAGSGFLRTGYERIGAQQTKKPHKQGRLGTRDFVREGSSYVRRVSPYDMLIDSEAPDYDIHSARWVGELIWVPLYELKYTTDDQINQDVVAELMQGHGAGAFADQANLRRANRNVRKAKYYEKKSNCVQVAQFWDKRYNRWNWYVPGIDQPLREDINPYLSGDGTSYLDGFPYVQIPFFYIPDSIYHCGIPRWIRHQQHELNRSRTQMFDYRRRLTTILYTILKDSMDKDELAKLEDPIMGEYLIVKFKEAISAVKIEPLPVDVWAIEAKIMADIERILGLDELSRSGRLPARTSANEIQKRSDLLAIKTQPRRNYFDEAAVDVARQMLQHEQNWTSKEQILKVTGRLGDYWEGFEEDVRSKFTQVQSGKKDEKNLLYVTYGPNDIAGEFDIDMQTMSKGDYDPDMRRAAFDKLFATTLQSLPIIAQFEGKVPVLSKFLELLFREWGFKEGRLVLPWMSVPAQVQVTQPTAEETGELQQGGGGGSEFEEPTPDEGPAMPGAGAGSELIGGLLGGA